jgi:hypothetical protein
MVVSVAFSLFPVLLHLFLKLYLWHLLTAKDGYIRSTAIIREVIMRKCGERLAQLFRSNSQFPGDLIKGEGDHPIEFVLPGQEVQFVKAQLDLFGQRTEHGVIDIRLADLQPWPDTHAVISCRLANAHASRGAGIS